ncbi:MAG: phosphoesterase [Acidobacteria bacterium]|nr:phosphoesterase [Acidobacteriota bacterium]
MQVRILYHDHCFDGAASAAFFSRFLRDKYHPNADFSYTGMAHKASQLFEDELFDGDINAIVDFKYSPNPKLTWWFDHHQSAFLTPEDQRNYESTREGRHLFFDPTYPSCTKFICHVARDKFGYEAPDLEELVRWADIVDSARYESPKAAVELGAAAMKITLVIEGAQGSDLVHHVIRLMQHQTLDEIMRDPRVNELWTPLYERHLKSIDLIRRVATHDKGVVTFDLIGHEVEGYNKFIPYYLYPDSVFVVSVSNQSFRTKVSVGSNPWVPGPLKHNIATICERYGGGGHPRVGAISFPKGDVETARKVAAEVAAELKQ